MSRPTPHETIPLTILTGFLGAGKTTVLNRVLAAQHQRRVAVLVNELGKIDIDAGLIRARAGDVMELAGGCVCHQIGVQRELWSALEDIVSRSRPDAVILETSGIAEPAEILRGLDEWQAARLATEGGDDDPGARASSDRKPRGSRLTVAAVIAVVDAEAGVRQLERYLEAREQIACADRVLLSKTDVAPTQAIARLHEVLNGLNRAAERAAFPDGGEGTAALVPWLFEAADRRRAVRPPPHAHAHPHAQTSPSGAYVHQLVAASHVDDVPLVAGALRLFFDKFDDRLVRVKGWVDVAGEPRRGFLERAGARSELRFGEPWAEGEARGTRLVLIGEALDEIALRRQLWACRASTTGAG